ncbi:hypothetical protein [Kibdelosporangium philippinense]|uniref:hypothetical protein n=1 Tax=Kibdelosporangium philippinense TaxID=211113 RepID=UPI003622D9CD
MDRRSTQWTPQVDQGQGFFPDGWTRQSPMFAAIGLLPQVACEEPGIGACRLPAAIGIA